MKRSTHIKLAILVALIPPVLAAEGGWEELMPGQLRRPLAVSLARNPMQPHARSEAPKASHMDRSGLAEALLAALPGRPQGIFRGAGLQALMLAKRCYLPGAELPLSPRSGAQGALISARLKSIDRECLVFLVVRQSGSGTDVAELALPLDPFLQER